MKYAEYVAWILLFKTYKFGEKICYSNWKNESYITDCFFIGTPCYITIYYNYMCSSGKNVMQFGRVNAQCITTWMKSVSQQCKKYFNAHMTYKYLKQTVSCSIAKNLSRA